MDQAAGQFESMNNQKLKDLKDCLQEERERISVLIHEIRRWHPENCTPQSFAVLQKGYLDFIESYLERIDSFNESYEILFEIANSCSGGFMPDLSPKSMAEVADWIRDELDEMDPNYGK